MNKLDQWAKRHRILASIAAFLIVAACLEFAHRIDQENDSRVYWQMASTRGTT